MSAPPSQAKDAVLLQSEPVSEDAQQVKGINWAALPPEHRSIIADFVGDLGQQGFQSSSIADAVQIINEMVRQLERWVGKSDCK